MPAHIVATAPSAEVLDEMGWRRGMPFADGRTAVHYGQRTIDDRLVFGRGGGRLGFAGRVIPTHFHDHRTPRASSRTCTSSSPPRASSPSSGAGAGR